MIVETCGKMMSSRRFSSSLGKGVSRIFVQGVVAKKKLKTHQKFVYMHFIWFLRVGPKFWGRGVKSGTPPLQEKVQKDSFTDALMVFCSKCPSFFCLYEYWS
jgi:hypothetical protein